MTPQEYHRFVNHIAGDLNFSPETTGFIKMIGPHTMRIAYHPTILDCLITVQTRHTFFAWEKVFSDGMDEIINLIDTIVSIVTMNEIGALHETNPSWFKPAQS